MVSADPLNGEDIVGFTYNPEDSTPTGVVAADDSTVLEFYYGRNTYAVTYEYTNEKPSGAPAAPSGDTAVKYGATVTIEGKPSAMGYDFNGWNTTDLSGNHETSFTMPAQDVHFKGSWENGNAKYTVEHWFQKLNDNDYTNTESETITTGKTGDTVTATPLTGEAVKGFTYNDNISEATGEIAADGTLVLKLYYDRNKYDIIYQYETGAPSGAPDISGFGETNVKYGAVRTVESDVALYGYTFSGWETDDTSVNPSTKEFTMPADDVIFKGSWTETDPVKTELSFKKVIEKSGNVDPSSQTFEFEYDYVFSGELAETELKVDIDKIDTNGVDTYNGIITIEGMPEQMAALESTEGALTIKEKNTGVADWTYSDKIYKLVWNGQGWAIYDNTEVGATQEATPVDEIVFTNTYTKQEELDDGAETGDNTNLALLLMLLTLSAIGASGTALYRRRQK